ncbi:hypothetical protein COCNU_scaffold001459G000030 [Cocos nucifera]|nr:hypothetical protein [Cocos nucifera]
MGAIPEAPKPIAVVPNPANGPDVNEDALTSPGVELPENALDDLGHDSPLLVDADPLPRGIPIRSLIRRLKKEIRCLKRKLRKIEDDLQESRKNTSEATVEVTHLRNLHKKNSISFSIWKDSFKKEMAELRRSTSDKTWKLMAKISSLEIDLTVAKKKIQLLEETLSWSIDRFRYDWDWSKRFSELQKQLHNAKA